MGEFYIGWAQVSITPDRPVYNLGQIYWRIPKYVHDPVTATALVLVGETDQVIFLSMDMVSTPDDAILRAVRENLHVWKGKALSTAKLIVNVTHTHNSVGAEPSVAENWGALLGVRAEALKPSMEVPENVMTSAEFEAFLVERMTQVILRAWETRKPGGISAASDYAVVAFNRRPVFGQGEGQYSKMYGDCSRADFTGFEGGSDHSAEMLYTWSQDGRLTGVVACIPCPSQVFELHSMITADYWGYTRTALRERLGNVYLLSLCGPAGDQNPLDLVRISKDNSRELVEWNAQAGEVWRNLDMADTCRDIADRIVDAIVRGQRKARALIDYSPILRHTVETLNLPLRKVTQEEYDEALMQARRLSAPYVQGRRVMTGAAQVALFEPMGILARWARQQKEETVPCAVHALRIGNTALATNPFELFCEYGLRIKARTKARQTILVQLADGRGGYLPTRRAIEGGSYSSKPASTLCDDRGGDALVERTIQLLDDLF